jgi:HK97 family phage major capsid protein
MPDRVNDLIRERGRLLERLSALADQKTVTSAEQAEFDRLDKEIVALNSRIDRVRAAQAHAAATAKPVAGQGDPLVPASAESDPYISEDAAKAQGCGTRKGLVVGGLVRMTAQAAARFTSPAELAKAAYGESHPITIACQRAVLLASVGASGGFIVPPDYMNEVIELLYAATVVRSSGPRVIPMPRGTMTIPGMATSATAYYGGEGQSITASQPTLRDIVASFKKLTALVPVSNDLMRYASPAADAMVRDNLVEAVAITEDTAFFFGDGTAGQPAGFLAAANRWVLNQGGTAGSWSTSGNSTAAVDNAGFTGDPRFGNNGGNFVTSNETYTLATVAQEAGGLVQKLDSANLRSPKRVWFMNPRTKNYLFNVQNSLGVYVFREELLEGKFLGYPYKTTTEIGINYHDTSSTNDDCSFLFLADMNEAMIFDSMSLELAVSRDGTYVDGSGNTQPAFGKDLTLIRAITEHDFQMRHDSGVAVDQFVRWAPAIS